MQKPELGRRIAKWYEKNMRDLPWRATKDPYRVLVSEIMLQQTRAETVKNRYPQFMERFPAAQDLALAGEDEVLKQWEGLGYYRRARNLHAAARYIVQNCGGIVPRTKEELLKVPGVGPYTAGAVLAIAYGLPEIAVDANAIRVMARVLKLAGSVQSAEGRSRIYEEMYAWLPEEAPGAFAQGMMDLGATVCRAAAPLCSECPIADACGACRDGMQDQYPVRNLKRKTPDEQWTAVCFTADDQMAFVKRPDHGLLAGLYGPPVLPGRCSAKSVIAMAEQYGLAVCAQDTGPEWSHQFTHVRWNMTSWIASVEQGAHARGLRWASREELRDSLAVPTAFRPLVSFWENV